MIALEVVVMILVAALGLLVVLTKNPLPQVIVFSLFGTSLALLFLLLQAPDVALSNIVVGLAYPAMVRSGRSSSHPLEPWTPLPSESVSADRPASSQPRPPCFVWIMPGFFRACIAWKNRSTNATVSSSRAGRACRMSYSLALKAASGA